MRKLWVCSLVFAFPAWAAAAPADDAQAVIAKAVKAMGGEAKLAGVHAFRTKSKGTASLAGNEISFTQETVSQLPNKYKEVMELEVMGQKVKVTSVFDGKTGWINANGMKMEVQDAILNAFKEAAHLMQVNRLVTLKDRQKYTLSPLGEAKVNNRPAVGVKVASKGYRDVNLYFDKESGLPVKIERRTIDPMSQQEVTEERFFLSYQDVQGMKWPKKATMHRDGTKMLEIESVETSFPEKLDDKEFAEP